MSFFSSEIADEISKTMISEPTFDKAALCEKVENAIEEVKEARNYPHYYTDLAIDEDLRRLKSKIKRLALYDYNQIGAEFQTSDSENSISRTWVEREKLFNGILPICRF